MSTSREISQRALRLSRLLLLLFCLAAVFPEGAMAETSEVLTTGPDVGRGIPYLFANALPYYEVTYRTATQENSSGRRQGAVAGSGAAAALRVLYTPTAVVPPPSWKRASCSEPAMLSVAENPAVLFYRDPQGFSFFFVYPSHYSQSCAFASAFLRRFTYFLGITKNSALSSFPAVLQLP